MERYSTAPQSQNFVCVPLSCCAIASSLPTEQLIEGLGGEKVRWLKSANLLGTKYVNLTGDVLVSAGVMAYLGPFTATFRKGQLVDWVALCKDKSIPCSESPTLAGVGNTE